MPDRVTLFRLDWSASVLLSCINTYVTRLEKNEEVFLCVLLL